MPVFSLLLLSALIGTLTVPQVPADTPPDAAVITNSGSTNTTGYRIIVRPNGAASVTITSDEPSTSEHTLPRKTVRMLFNDLSAAQPLDALRIERCMKSVSFGTRTFVSWHGASTPDISCPSTNANVARLYRDVLSLSRELDLPARAARKFRRTL